MRSTMRGTTVMILLMMLLSSGALQARTPAQSRDRASRSGPELILKKVWNLLALWWDTSGSGAMSKNGCGLDPAGQPLCGGGPGGTTEGTGDNGCGLDPAGLCKP